MRKIFKILTWAGSILFLIVCTMLTMGLVYNIPDNSLFSDIFKVLFVILIPTALVWVGVVIYGMFTDEI
jgi:hypothetical protein